MAQRLGKELTELVPHVDYVLGTDSLALLPDIIEGKEGTSPVMTAFGHENLDLVTPEKESDFSAFVTISRGCDNYCAYCIVPYVRGRERSHAPDQIVSSVQKLVDDGVVEITLLGQNVNSYRDGSVGFPELLERVAVETDIERIRFMTSHPKDLSESLIDVIAAQPKVMSHIHLPLQSGCDRVLEKMGRGYSVEHYLSIVHRIREKLGYVSLTTDLIVGFPSETEQEYEQTLAVIDEVKYDAAFMFRYSVRPGTAAADLEDDVPEEEKIHRLSHLIKVQQTIARESNQREVGQIRPSLCEGFSRRSHELYRARTEGNKIVLFPGTDISTGRIMPVRITSADAFTLHGELAEGVV
jgi:tRNA-2-methylthio-N6-dimethylallyladenosine synthase